jgi:cystathionine beta-lyase
MEFDAVERRSTDSIKWDDTARRFGRENLLPLWVADMDFPVFKALEEALIQRARHPVYGYSFYSDRFYEAIQWWYTHRFDWTVERNWIVPEHGVVVSINIAIDAFTEKGDGVLVQTPIYPPFVHSVNHHKRTLLENRLDYKEGRYTIDWKDFEAKAKKAKLFLLCSPHNPTTRAWSQEELTRMALICKTNGVTIIADEIHSDMVHAHTHIPIGKIPEAKAITLTLHAPSKTFNIAGLNTSYVMIPNPTLRERYLESHRRTGLEHGTPFGLIGLEIAYTSEGAAWLDRLMRVLQENIAFVRDYFREHIPQIVPTETEATFLMWLDCRGLELDDEALENLFFDVAGLALNTGISFGKAGSGFMRLNIGTSREILEKALKQLKDAVSGRRT